MLPNSTDRGRGEPGQGVPPDRVAVTTNRQGQHGAAAGSLLIITPVLDDWASALDLLAALDRAAREWAITAVDVVVVDDGSLSSPPWDGVAGSFENLRQVTLVQLACNVGHQRAIAVGLSYAFGLAPRDFYLVMDSDGEDRPADIASLLRAAAEHPEAIVVAKRTKRRESWRFRAFYLVYKRVFRILTGRHIDFGNFCVIPRSQLSRLTHMTELWNHFAGTILRSRARTIGVPTVRGGRYAGSSQMDFVSLVVHGLSAMAVFNDVAFVRLLMLAMMLSSVPIFMIAIIIMTKLFTNLAIPGWATMASGFAVTYLLQFLTVSVATIFSSLSGRSGFPFVPAIHSLPFIRETKCLHQTPAKPPI